MLGGAGNGSLHDVVVRIVVRQQGFHLAAQCIVAGAGRGKKGGAIGRREVGGAMKQVFNARPTIFAHAGFSPRRDLRSQASPRRRSRLTVGTVKRIAVAISSRSMPPNYRSSITLALRSSIFDKWSRASLTSRTSGARLELRALASSRVMGCAAPPRLAALWARE